MYNPNQEHVPYHFSDRRVFPTLWNYIDTYQKEGKIGVFEGSEVFLEIFNQSLFNKDEHCISRRFVFNGENDYLNISPDGNLILIERPCGIEKILTPKYALSLPNAPSGWQIDGTLVIPERLLK